MKKFFLAALFTFICTTGQAMVPVDDAPTHIILLYFAVNPSENEPDASMSESDRHNMVTEYIVQKKNLTINGTLNQKTGYYKHCALKIAIDILNLMKTDQYDEMGFRFLIKIIEYLLPQTDLKIPVFADDSWISFDKTYISNIFKIHRLQPSNTPKVKVGFWSPPPINQSLLCYILDQCEKPIIIDLLWKYADHRLLQQEYQRRTIRISSIIIDINKKNEPNDFNDEAWQAVLGGNEVPPYPTKNSLNCVQITGWNEIRTEGAIALDARIEEDEQLVFIFTNEAIFDYEALVTLLRQRLCGYGRIAFEDGKVWSGPIIEEVDDEKEEEGES